MNHHATAEEIARLYGWSAGYVRKLASLHRWRRMGRNPTQYNLRDVGRYVGQHDTRTGQHR